MSALAAAGTRRILITGGTKGGLGHEAARQLLQAGHEVILTVRDDAKGKEAVDALVNAKGGAPRDKLHYIKMDLGSFDSVKAAGAEVVQKFSPLDAVLLNAGLCEAGTAGPKQTKDGFETTYQVNHLSHFLFVHTILPALLGSKALGGPRIVAVSSDMHRGVKAYPASPSFAHTTMKDVKAANLPWDAFQAYSLAKLCTLWYVYKLSALAKQANVPITIDAVCPGWVPATNLALKEPSFFIKFTKALFHTVLKFMPFAASYKDGSNRLADLTAGKAALAEGSKEGAVVLGSGRYFQSGKFNKSSPDSYDTAKQDELWNLSLQAVGISGDYLSAK